MLGEADEFAGASSEQVLFGYLEAVAGGLEDAQAVNDLRGLAPGEEYTMSLGAAARDAAAQLVQLGKAEALRVEDNHRGGVGYVHAHLDDRSADEDLDFPGAEACHHVFALLGPHLAMNEAQRRVISRQLSQLIAQALIHLCRRLRIDLAALRHQRAHDVRLMARREFFDHHFQSEVPLRMRQQLCGDGLAARRQFVNHRDVKLTVESERQRPGDRRRRHHYHVRAEALCRKGGPLLQPEAVLLIYDGD